MLESIYIENFAIIDQLQIEFHDQMTVLTGETGAGKSIIIDAIGQLAGNRMQASFIKSGADEAFIEGVFSIKDNSKVLEKLKEYRINYEDKLIVSKTFNRNNKTTIKINYRNVSLTALKAIMQEVIDIHSQFETHNLFNSQNHIQILDDYIGEQLSDLLISYQQAYEEYRNANKIYQQTIKEELNDEQLEYYQAQLEEINSIDLSTIDEEELEKEKAILVNFEKTSERINNYRQFINGSQGVLTQLNDAINQIAYLSDQDNYKKIYEKMYDLYYELTDLDEELIYEYNSNQYDEYRLEEIQDILFKLNRLKRKYGVSIEAILKTKAELEEKIDLFTNREDYIAELENNVATTYDKAEKLANKISMLRKQKALEFTNKIMSELKSLYLDKVIFEVVFEKCNLHKNGFDEICFMISTNSGQTLQPLDKIASGGEMSRIMLAIKTVSLINNSVETIIFDEADTGVSGKVAESIGAKMQTISKKYQVLCITHLAQVASFANNHYLIEKKLIENSTTVEVRELNEDDSILEIAKLISGKDVSKESIDHAKKLKTNHS